MATAAGGHDPQSDTSSVIESAEIFTPVFSEAPSYDVLRALGGSRAFKVLRALAEERAQPA